MDNPATEKQSHHEDDAEDINLAHASPQIGIKTIFSAVETKIPTKTRITICWSLLLKLSIVLTAFFISPKKHERPGFKPGRCARVYHLKIVNRIFAKCGETL